MDIVMPTVFCKAIPVICNVGFEPRDDSFTECTLDQYDALERQDHDRTWRWFVVTGGWFEGRRRISEEPVLVDDAERRLLLATAAWIIETSDASGAAFAACPDRLDALSSFLLRAICQLPAVDKHRPRLPPVSASPAG